MSSPHQTIAISFLLGIALMAVTAVVCRGEERALTLDHIVASVASVETGVRYVGFGEVRGKWSVGSAGEVSPWQLSGDVLRDLGVARKSGKINRDVAYAESLARGWLTTLYGRYGEWGAALQAYHRGHGGRGSVSARDYASRVIALAQRIASEEQ